MIAKYLLILVVILIVGFVLVARIFKNKSLAKNSKILAFYYRFETYIGLILWAFVLWGVFSGISQLSVIDQENSVIKENSEVRKN